ncbi:MAG TPA: universal stress protein [Chthonomonadaceae bacterium]|nr:universal stress protein [Chthonomonadaceae bacterium]
MFQKILVGSDGSEDALKAARTAAEIAVKFDGEIVLVTVFNPAPLLASGALTSGAVISTETVYQAAEEAQVAVEARTGKVLAEAGARYTARRELGHPVDKIVRVAEEEQADLIVLGSRGLGGFQRFLLGSVSDGVLHHAHCPVLIVR